MALLFRYYNLLYYVERRFFPPDRNLGVYFEWYDSLTGVPSCQRTIAFEKACTLFNLGAIYTQIGARHDRRTERGLDAAVDSFLRAAGIFRHIYDTFTNAPSMDLKPQVLDVLVSLMLSQARECLFEKLQLQIEALALTESSHVSRERGAPYGDKSEIYCSCIKLLFTLALSGLGWRGGTAVTGIQRDAQEHSSERYTHLFARMLGGSGAAQGRIVQR